MSLLLEVRIRATDSDMLSAWVAPFYAGPLPVSFWTAEISPSENTGMASLLCSKQLLEAVSLAPWKTWSTKLFVSGISIFMETT